MALPSHDNPLQQMQRSACAFWQQAAQQLQQGAEGVGRALSHAAQIPGRSLQRQQGVHVQPLLPGIAVRLPPSAHLHSLVGQCPITLANMWLRAAT